MSGSSLKHGDGVESVKRAKWGFTLETAQPLLARLLALHEMDMLGFSCHIGHLSNRPEAFAAIAESFGITVRCLSQEMDFRPRVLDLGGGWAREREPEQRGEDMQRITIEMQAEAACMALMESLGPLRRQEYQTLPELWVEPGRYISGNAQVLLATVGAIKQDAGYRWVHVDASCNDLQRIETGGFYYHVLPANLMHVPCNTLYEIVGGTCFRSVLGAGRSLPPLARDDIVAILDSGMYAEVFANQFNSLPRPAAVLVGPSQSVEIIRERESIADVFAQHRVPERLTIPSKE
jgi:diaminopimelate decarboxylase